MRYKIHLNVTLKSVHIFLYLFLQNVSFIVQQQMISRIECAPWPERLLLKYLFRIFV